MTTPSPVVQDYVRSAQFHLNNAFGMYMQVREQQYESAFVELAYMASQIWDTGIDLLSTIMLLDGLTGLGTSTSRYNYLRYTLNNRYPDIGLRTDWRYLASLHGFQHNLDLPEPRFVEACHQSGELIVNLNGMLPEYLRLADENYRWLRDVS